MANKEYVEVIDNISIMNKMLMSKSVELDYLEYLPALQNIEKELATILHAYKAQASTHYIWRTQSDEKVRSSHAANNGKIFSWDNPPVTGRPGEDYNCRCWAEDYKKGQTEYVQQTLLTLEADYQKWKTVDFLKHFYFGKGRVVTLPRAGYLSGIVDYYFYKIFRNGVNTYNRINNQIINKARVQESGTIEYDFNNSYSEFGDYYWVFGGGTVKGEFKGSMHKKKDMLYIQGDIGYRYTDTFTDPANIREFLLGSSEPLDANIIELLITDAYGVFFDIIGTWHTTFKAEVKIDPKESVY